MTYLTVFTNKTRLKDAGKERHASYYERNVVT